MNPLRNYLIVTAAYWAFMLTDGALRMLVLLYFAHLGYSPVSLAFLFLLYEACGVITNLFGGWLATRYGLKATLIGGLALQSVAILLLSRLDGTWSAALGVAWAMGAQALSGIAKDLTKMSAKTSVKVLAPGGDTTALYRWVALLTGSKNAIKGLGFFVGGLLLQTVGFRPGLWVMALAIGGIAVAALMSLPRDLGQRAANPRRQARNTGSTDNTGTTDGAAPAAGGSAQTLSTMFQMGHPINLLSTARLLLFGARDIWFVVGAPVFLAAQFGWNGTQVGAFMAVWVIGYGGVQAFAPGVTRWRTNGRVPGGRLAFELVGLLLASMVLLLVLHVLGVWPRLTVVGGLCLFGGLFALNSAVHSFLILDYADGDRVAMSVGFYYMANAIGRLLGTLLSGVLYQVGGFTACLVGSTLFLALATVVTSRLPPDARHAGSLDSIGGGDVGGGD